MKALLDASLGREFAHFVVFVGGALYIIHSRILAPCEAGHDHLRQADILGPGNAGFLIVAELLDAEVRTHAGDAVIVQNFPDLRAPVFGEAGEAVLGITHWRAQLDGLKSGLSKELDGGGKKLCDPFLDSPRLAPDWAA